EMPWITGWPCFNDISTHEDEFPREHVKKFSSVPVKAEKLSS
ncbi:8025_t:CDS:1, partial [Acaulospora morrowiae]